MHKFAPSWVWLWDSSGGYERSSLKRNGNRKWCVSYSVKKMTSDFLCLLALLTMPCKASKGLMDSTGDKENFSSLFPFSENKILLFTETFKSIFYHEVSRQNPLLHEARNHKEWVHKAALSSNG